jgi:SAM-dependent methyltransferase
MERRSEKQEPGHVRGENHVEEDTGQGYNEKFARVYSLRWGGFASSVAPHIHALYQSLPIASSNKRLLDIACGTGQLITWFLERGFACTGIDASSYMLALARTNAGHYAEEGKARFIQADAAGFDSEGGFGLAVSTFDALNHLPGREGLRSCFACTFRVLEPGGCFLFDLNTIKGLKLWNSLTVEETDELFILNRGIFDGERYERFEQTAYNTAFSMKQTGEDLSAAGFRGVYFASLKDLSAPVEDPEELTRAFVVARKPE